MYGHNQFSQSPHYGSQYPASYPPYGGNYYYPVYSAWSQGGDVGPPGQEDPTVVILNKRQENQLMIENFIAGVEESSKVDAKKPSVEEKTLRISEARDAVINAFRKILELEKLREKLNSDCNSSDVDWQKKYRDCTAIRDDLVEMMKKFGDDEGVVETLKKQVNRRRKKRLREAGKRAAWKVKKSLNAERRAQLHAEADAWIREKQDIIEREKQVESLRKDADIVLSDVRAKRSDARKFLGLLQELQNLRRIKVSIARARGENLPLAADQAFDNIIGQLHNQWSCLDREYSIEERGLKLMLKTDNEEKIEKQKRSTFDDWENVIFGKKLPSFDTSRGDLHGLVMVRHAWDKYANFKGKGSRVPIGWVMPVAPSSAAWQRCLKRE